MIDVRIVVSPVDAENIYLALRDLSLKEYNVAISSIIPSTDMEIVRKATKGADFVLVCFDVEGLEVSHWEKIIVDDDIDVVRDEIENGILRCALKSSEAFLKARKLEGEVLMLGERIEKLQKENSQLRKNFSLVEKENLEIKKEIERLQGENEVYRKEREKFGEIKELNSYPLNDLWKEISKTEVPTTEEAIVAIKRLNLEGKVLVSCGYIAAPSREEALDLLRIVKIAKDLKEKNIQ